MAYTPTYQLSTTIHETTAYRIIADQQLQIADGEQLVTLEQVRLCGREADEILGSYSGQIKFAIGGGVYVPI